MLSLKTRSSMEAALRSNLNPAIRHLIRQRMEQLGGFTDNDLDGLVEFNIVEPGDTPSLIEAALGFSPLTNIIDGSRFGDDGFMPSFEWMLDHRSFFELVYILTDDGFGTIVIVPDDPGVEFDLHLLCLEHSGRPG